MDEGVSPLLQTWYIIESRGIGKGKRHEITPDGLQIGRSAAADIIVLSSTVNEHHAIIEWDSLREVYTIKDLDTRNGTFVNDHLLRGTTKPIERGDSLRFGYDTDQVFRVEVVTKSKSSLQTQLAEPVDPPQLPPLTSVGVVTAPTVSTVHCVLPNTLAVPSTTTVHVPSTAISLSTSPTHQSVTVQAAPITMAAAVIPLVPHIISDSTQSVINTPVAPIDSDTSVNIPQNNSSDNRQSNKDLLRVRIDGRKSVPVYTGSPLYGVPSWWGEDDSAEDTAVPAGKGRTPGDRVYVDDEHQMPFSDSELIPRKTGSQILREFDDDSCICEAHRKQHVGRHEVSNRLRSVNEVETSSSVDTMEPHTQGGSSVEPSTSFMIEFDQSQTTPRRRKPPSFITKRSTTSFPSDLSKASNSKRNIKPSRKFNKKNKNSSISIKIGAVKESQSTTLDTSTDIPLDKPLPIKGIRSNPKIDETFTLSDTPHHKPPPHGGGHGDLVNSQDLQSQSEVLVRVAPAKAHSQPSSLQTTPYATSEPGSRTGSARKQWTIENEIPHSLIMASIETRMSRLAETAQKTANNVRYVVDSVKKDGHVLENNANLPSPIQASSNLPLWKIVNKEYQNICKYLIEVERSLKDINHMIIAEQITTTTDDVDCGDQPTVLEDSIEKDNIGLFNVNEEDEDTESTNEFLVDEDIRIELSLDYDGDGDDDSIVTVSSSDEYFSLSSSPDC